MKRSDSTASRSERLISFSEAGRLLGLDESSVRCKRCDTDKLTHVPMGRKRVMVILSEVEALIESKIAEARGHDAKLKERAERNSRRVAEATRHRAPRFAVVKGGAGKK